MNELLQKHGCANVFSVPDGLKELMSDITREVLREQPEQMFDFIASYLSALLITREHGILAVKILDNLCDCKPSISEHLLYIGLHKHDATHMSQIIEEEIKFQDPETGEETVKETEIVKRALEELNLDEETMAKVCQIARNAYRDYWYRKKLMEKTLKRTSDEPWELAAQHTLEIYKTTKPSFSELTRATEIIQSAYRGYHIRRSTLRHLKRKPKTEKPKVELPGPPLDIAASREIELGPVMNINPPEDNVAELFDKHDKKELGLQYDPKKTITHVEDLQVLMASSDAWPQAAHTPQTPSRKSSQKSHMHSTKEYEVHMAKVSTACPVPRGSGAQLHFASRPTEPRQVKMPSLDEDKVLDTMPKISFAEVNQETIPKISFAEDPEAIYINTDDGGVIEEIIPHVRAIPELLAEVPEDIVCPSGNNTDADDSDVEDLTV